MNNKCVNLKIRTKKGVKYFYCSRRKAVVSFEECKCCLNKEYKKTSKIAVKTRIKPISKKRVFVSKKTYSIVLEECKDFEGNYRCMYCNCINALQLHHIRYRSERKDLIDEPNNCIMLCESCHKLVHSNKRKYQPILLDIKKEGSR